VLSAKNVLNVEKTHLRAFLACRLAEELRCRVGQDLGFVVRATDAGTKGGRILYI